MCIIETALLLLSSGRTQASCQCSAKLSQVLAESKDVQFPED